MKAYFTSLSFLVVQVAYLAPDIYKYIFNFLNPNLLEKIEQTDPTRLPRFILLHRLRGSQKPKPFRDNGGRRRRISAGGGRLRRAQSCSHLQVPHGWVLGPWIFIQDLWSLFFLSDESPSHSHCHQPRSSCREESRLFSILGSSGTSLKLITR